MIPVEPQPEPEDFEERVRKPGTEFLKKIPHPKSREWRGKEYWQTMLPKMRDSYKGICAYCAHWISSMTGSGSIDHFLPKSQYPALAYEWNNFRYSSLKFNRRKGIHNISDPFRIELDWFIIDFPSLIIKSNPNAPSGKIQEIEDTIKILKLNTDTNCVKARQSWIMNFCRDEISFSFLKRRAPFIAYELERQALVEKIATIMKTR